MTELKSFKKYSWLISAIIAIIVGISAINIADLSFLPENIKVYVVGLIAICGILVKIIPENYRVNRAEEIVKEDLKDKVIINVDSESIVSQLQDYVDEKYGNWEGIPEDEEPSHDDENIIEEIDPSQQYEEIIGDEDGA
jgi:hypothetical protein